MSYPGGKIFQELRKNFGVILVEADGSRHMPVKIPAPYEPVIPACSDEIAVIMGHHAIGRSVGEVCQRFDSAEFPSVYGLDNLIDAQRLLADFGIVSEIFAVTADNGLAEILMP